MEGIGTRLRAIRRQWGLSLREVEERSMSLGQKWGDESYQISASFLARVEREKHEAHPPGQLRFQMFLNPQHVGDDRRAHVLTSGVAHRRNSRRATQPSERHRYAVLVRPALFEIV